MKKQIEAFIEDRYPGAQLIPLAGDVSVRTYYRIISPGSDPLVLCYDPSLPGSEPGSCSFLKIADLYRERGIPSVEIVDRDPAAGIIVQEDLGDLHLADVAGKGVRAEISRSYMSGVDLLLMIQQLPLNRISAPLPFNTEKLMFEFDYFITHGLKNYYQVPESSPEISELRGLFEIIASELDRPDEFVVCHRDYHSRNIMIKKGDLRIIDFQDSMPGLPLYDTVSLLRDSYTRLDKGLFVALKDYYYEGSLEAGIHNYSRDEFEYLFELSGFQRNVKALGTFTYQSAVRGRVRYEESIPLTMEYLKEFSDRADIIARASDLLFSLTGGFSKIKSS